ncbi:VN1R1 protein, partial [Amia calva]|nr:VN1R1 protein [Amia calva]
MNSQAIIRGVLYLTLTLLGVPGNLLVMWAFCHLALCDRKLLPADAIVLHLASVNFLVVAVRCFLEMLAAFSIANVFNDTGCKSVIFIYRTSRALSIWLTCVLSGFQCVSIAPPGSRCSPSVVFSMGSHNDSTQMEHSINVEFCFVRFPSSTVKQANGAVQVVRDVVPIFLMVLASLFILVFLYRHSQQVKSIRSAKQNQKQSAETRAAKTVVTLVTLYVLFYGIDNVLWIYTLTVTQTMSSSLVSDLRIFFSSLYAAVSPIIIIASNKKVNSRLTCVRPEKGPQSMDTTLSTL